MDDFNCGFFRGKKGDIASYKQDYKNIEKRIDISAKEFKDLIESNFDKLKTNIESTTNFNNKKIEVCSTVEEKETERTIMYNKSFICIKEAKEKEKGIIIGIHDLSNYKAYFS